MTPTQDPINDTVLTQPVAQFQSLSCVALRHQIAELNRNQSDLKERLRQHEQVIRNAVGVSVLSVVLAVASISFTLCQRATTVRTSIPLAAVRSSNPTPAVMVSMR